MLESPGLRQRRERFGRLFAAVLARRQRAGAAPAESEAKTLAPAAACAAAACPFAWLGADLVCVVIEQLLRLAGEEAPAAVRDVAALLGTCRYVDVCFREHGDRLRLEVAARGQTAVVPRDLATAARPYLDQVLREERSRFDLRILESAVRAMVTHCAARHCQGARETYNRRLAQQVQASSVQRPLTLDAALENDPPPRVRVAWCEDVQQFSSPSCDAACCELVTRCSGDDGSVVLRCVSNEPARVFDPRCELEQRCLHPEIMTEGRVRYLCASWDREWVAVAYCGEAAQPSEQKWSVGLWNAASGSRVCVRELAERHHVVEMWFRTEGAELLLVLILAAFSPHDEDGLLAPMAMLQLRVDETGFGSEAVPVQFAPQLGSVPGCTLLVPVKHADDTRAVRRSGWQGTFVLDAKHDDDYCFATLRSSKFACADGAEQDAIWQAVRIDCAAARAGDARRAIEAVTRVDDCFLPACASTNSSRFLPMQATASPDGWRVVVNGLRRAWNGGKHFYVHVYERHGDKYVTVHRVNLEYAIQRAHGQAGRVKLPPGPPKSFALSPCGRFVLLSMTFVKLFYAVASPESQPTEVAGVCVLDIDRLRHGHVACGWIECRHDSVPRRVRWNRAGLWFESREGVLLLGM